jgi:hypothetical protein
MRLRGARRRKETSPADVSRQPRPRMLIVLFILALTLNACQTSPPRDINDSCEIFSDRSGWYRDANDAFERWGVPVQLAIIYQESRFVHDAKPPRDTLLWVIPWGRITSAYGYAQVMDTTWDWYKKNAGNRGADRDDFADVVDFIGWYCNMSHQRLGISRDDAYRQYLAYHEGQGGYSRKSYLKKPWLMKVARKVEAQANRYQAQLARCRDELDKGWWLWPFRGQTPISSRAVSRAGRHGQSTISLRP